MRKLRETVLRAITAWLVVCGWQALVASAAYLSGNLILALVTMNNPDYSPTQWQGTLVYWALMALAIVANLFWATILPRIDIFILILHVVGFFAFMIPMVCVCFSRILIQNVHSALKLSS